MKALIVSDNHGSTKEIAKLKEKYADVVDVMIHCGDSELRLEDEAMQGYQTVRGNCDYYETRFPDELLEEVAGVRIFITHGHLHGIKRSLTRIAYRAEELGAQVVCFGHSHIRGAQKIDGILYINPGSILMPRVYSEKTYALLTYDKAESVVEFLDMDGNLVERIVL